MVENKLEYTKFEERLDWALSLLKSKFKLSEEQLLHEACEIAKTLFVRSEIAYSGKKQ
jgi:hypothetical protein